MLSQMIHDKRCLSASAFADVHVYKPDRFETGFVAGDILTLRVGFSGAVRVTGVPKLRLGIGDDERFARFDSQISVSEIEFGYRIGNSDHDRDGISVPADALDLSGGSIVSFYREETPVFTDIGRHAIEDSPEHRVRDFSGGIGLPIRRIYIAGGPSNPPLGYLDNETIWIDVRWYRDIEVSGWPRLLIEVGNELRYAVFDRASGTDVRFRYLVRYDDHDPDGISIPEDAIELHEGSIVSVDGRVPVDTNLGFNAIDDAAGHEVRRTMPFADIRECSIERREVRRHPAGFVLDEWNGTPFRVDIVRNFPSFVTDEDLLDLFGTNRVSRRRHRRALGVPDIGGWRPRAGALRYAERVEHRLPSLRRGALCPAAGERPVVGLLHG